MKEEFGDALWESKKMQVQKALEKVLTMERKGGDGASALEEPRRHSLNILMEIMHPHDEGGDGGGASHQAGVTALDPRAAAASLLASSSAPRGGGDVGGGWQQPSAAAAAALITAQLMAVPPLPPATPFYLPVSAQFPPQQPPLSVVAEVASAALSSAAQVPKEEKKGPKRPLTEKRRGKKNARERERREEERQAIHSNQPNPLPSRILCAAPQSRRARTAHACAHSRIISASSGSTSLTRHPRVTRRSVLYEKLIEELNLPTEFKSDKALILNAAVSAIRKLSLELKDRKAKRQRLDSAGTSSSSGMQPPVAAMLEHPVVNIEAAAAALAGML